MFLHAFYKTKKVSCILLAVLILWMTPACDYLDTAHMETVDAASVAVGVTAVSLLKVAAAAFGVVITTALTVKAVDAFTTWLQENGSQEDIELWNQADTDAPSFAYSESLAGKVGEWLRTQFTSLDSGEVTIAYGDGEITNGVPAVCPAAEESLRNNYLFPTIAKAPTYDHYRAVDKPPNFVNVTRYHDKNPAKIAEIFQRKRSWFPMPWPLSSF